MFDFLKNKGVTLEKLTNPQIRDGNNNGIGLGNFTPAQRTAIIQNTPLWFYILREAEFNNGKLKGVGARIVAETFHRAMEGARTRSCGTTTSSRRSARTTRPSGWSISSSSRSRERRRC